MLIKTGFNIARTILFSNTKLFHILENISGFNSKCFKLHKNYLHSQQNFNSIIFKRFKNERKISEEAKDKEEEEEEEEDSIDEDVVPDYLNTLKAKTITATVSSLRLDLIAKIGLKISRAKLDKEFYKGNIRVNGEKYLKKSKMVQVGDEIDFIQNESPTNPNYLIIDRCILSSVKVDPESETFNVKLIQNKSLLVENYKDKWNQNK